MCFYSWRKMPAILLMLGALLSGACTENTESPQQGVSEPVSLQPVQERAGKTYVYKTYVYMCSDNSRFTARIEGETAWLFLPSGTISLPHVEAASGAKYSDGTVTFWSKGESAMLEGVSSSSVECKNNRAQAIWEDAKLRGADFRATGNEPGWHMEISKSYGIVLVTNYGSDRYQFAPSEPSSDADSRTTKYQANDGGHELVISLEGKRCTDSMSGEQFETTVTVMINGNKLNGCGKALH